MTMTIRISELFIKVSKTPKAQAPRGAQAQAPRGAQSRAIGSESEGDSYRGTHTTRYQPSSNGSALYALRVFTTAGGPVKA